MGQLVDTPLLPVIVPVVCVNHAPSKVGRLWLASKARDFAGVISAIQDGCSTEETGDDVRVSVHLGVTTPTNAGNQRDVAPASRLAWPCQVPA